MGTIVTKGETQRCRVQLSVVKTKDLREMAAMMEHSNGTELHVLLLIIAELRKRGVSIDHLQLGVEDVNAVEVLR